MVIHPERPHLEAGRRIDDDRALGGAWDGAANRSGYALPRLPRDRVEQRPVGIDFHGLLWVEIIAVTSPLPHRLERRLRRRVLAAVVGDLVEAQVAEEVGRLGPIEPRLPAAVLRVAGEQQALAAVA